MICDDGVRVGFDYLIIGNGITTNHFGIPGAADYTMSMYTRAEALRVRDTIFGSLEIIAGRSDPNTAGFTVVICRAAGPPAWKWQVSWPSSRPRPFPRRIPELNPARVHVVLVEMTEHLLAPFDDSLAPVRVAGIDQAWRGRSAEDRDLRGGGGSRRLQGRLLDAG